MAGIFGGSKRANSDTPIATNVRIQTAVQGRPRAIGAGQGRLAGNVIWYGDFYSTGGSSSGGGGKGGGAASGGKGSQNDQTEYYASWIVSICEGPVILSPSAYNGDNFYFAGPLTPSQLYDLEVLGITPNYGVPYSWVGDLGDYSQTGWTSYIADPNQALNYRGEFVVGFANFSLGGSAALPSFSYEVQFARSYDIPTLGPDANPADWISDFLTNQDWGLGFPAGLIADLSDFRNWCRATSMLISPVLTDQAAANSHLRDLMQGLIADFYWSGGLLHVAPYATATVSANGYTYTPSLTPVYALGPTQFLPNQGSLAQSDGESSALSILRKDPAQVINKVQVEYLDRNNLYNPTIIYELDDAGVFDAQRIRPSDVRSQHFFCLAAAASASATLQLAREQIVCQYEFTLPQSFILLDPFDIVTITSDKLGLTNWPVRIIGIQENEDRSLTFTAEDFPAVVHPPLYGRQTSIGPGRNINADPGSPGFAVFFEPTDAEAGDLEVWAAVSGGSLWGGCNIWVSYDGANYANIGEIVGNSRCGVTTSALSAISPTPSLPQTIDSSTLGVDLTTSRGTLLSASETDMLALNSACWVSNSTTTYQAGGEIIAYQAATLTAASKYNLSPLVRGAYGSTIAAHPAGSPFVRLDAEIEKFPFTADRIGATIYIKLQGFNIYGGGLQNLANLSPFTYQIQGTALASPLPNITNPRVYFSAGVMQLQWDEITDFRPFQYEIRKGPTWASALKVAVQAHPPFNVTGDDTYWIAAVATPRPGLTVYSASPVSVVVAGALLSQNVVAKFDEQATGWTGVLTNVAPTGVNPTALLRLGGTGNILTDPDVLNTPDILDYGGVAALGYYEIPSAHYIDAGYVAQCLCGVTYGGTGSPISNNFLSLTDVLNTPDILGGASVKFVDVHPEISISQVSPPVWSAYQKFSPGVYSGRMFKFRLALTSTDAQTVAYATAFSFQVTVPGRTDHYLNQSVPSGGLTIIFKPDGAALAGAFTGGPNGSTTPAVSVSWQGQTGDTYTITGLSLSQMTINFFDKTGAAVARVADAIQVQGF